MQSLLNNKEALHMPKYIIKSAQTQGIGFVLILGYYFEKCGINQITDQKVRPDPT